MLQKFFDKAKLAVVDRKGNYLRSQVIYNTPMAMLYPDQDMPVIIDWRADDERAKRPDEATFWKGVTYEGKQYRPFAWGSGIKQWRSLGLTKDFLVQGGLQQKVEQSVYGARYLLASNGGFYGAAQGRLRIGIVPPNTRIPGTHIVIADGHGAMLKSCMYLNEHPAIQLGRQRPSYQLAQWLDLSKRKVWAEVKDLIDSTFMKAIDPATFDPVQFALANGYLSSEKEELARLHPDMRFHPAVADTAAKATKDIWFRLATSVPFNAENKLLIPIQGHTMVWPGHAGKVIGYRYPLDGPVAQALEIERDPEWEAYLSDLEVIQVTVASREFFSKGLLSLVDDLGPYSDCDALICTKDVKMANPKAFDVESLDQVKELGVIEIDGGVFAIQRFGKGSVLGIDAEWAAAAIGADVDGDMMGVADANAIPATWQSIRDSFHIDTKKVPKTSTWIEKSDRRAELAVTNMRNIVGTASNELSSAMSIGDVDQVAEDLNYASKAVMLTELNRCVKYGTDGFKSLLDMDTTEAILFTFGGHFTNKYGSKPAWLAWRRSDIAFVTRIPKVGWKENWSDEDKEICLPPIFKGSVAKIARYVLPAIEKVFDRKVAVKPLAHYRSWGIANPSLERHAKELQFWFNQGRADMDREMEDGKKVANFKRECQAHASEYCAENKLDPWAVANALWVYAHSGTTSGASVFYLFPEEARRIVQEGGTKQQKKSYATKVLGLKYQLPGAEPRFECDVEVTAYQKQMKDRVLMQTVLLADLDGQVAPDPKYGYPERHLAVVESKSIQPPVGKYHARLSVTDGSAYLVELTPLK